LPKPAKVITDMAIPTITIMTDMITGIRTIIIINVITGNDINNIMVATIKSTVHLVVIIIVITTIIAIHSHVTNMRPEITITQPVIIYEVFLKFRDHPDVKHRKNFCNTAMG